MTVEPSTEGAIRIGLRWEAVVSAIAAAEEALEVSNDEADDADAEVVGAAATPGDVDSDRPAEGDVDDLDEPADDSETDDAFEDDDDVEDDEDLEDEDVAWSDDERAEVLEAVVRVRDELAGGVDTATVLGGWRDVDVDALDLETMTPESEVVLDLDLALSDLERAESALVAAGRLEAALADAITPSDRDDGFDEGVRDELVGLLDEIRDVLASGGMLPAGLMDQWADALRALGYLRTVERPGVDDDSQAVGFTRQRIEQFPPGRRFEPIAIFDGWLYNIGFTDTMDEASDDLPDEVDAPAASVED